MTNWMSADLGGLRDTQPHVRWLSAFAAETLARLSAALDAEGACWGNDRMGEAFGSSYAPAAQQVRDAGALLRDGISHVADALGTVVNNLDSAEDRAQSRLS
jgi:hypothetical protein